MKYLKLFEGFYEDKFKQFRNEIRKHVENELTDFINLFKDEFDDVIYKKGYFNEQMNLESEIIINFKNPPSRETIKNIVKYYQNMKETVEKTGDYWINLDCGLVDEELSEKQLPYILKNLSKVEYMIIRITTR